MFKRFCNIKIIFVLFYVVEVAIDQIGLKAKSSNLFMPTSISEVNQSQMQQVMTEHFDMNCEQCKTIFSSLSDAISHYSAKHNVQNGFVKCCGMKFKERKHLNDHIVWHLNPDAFTCSICGVMHKTRKNYHAHQFLHRARARREFKCDICQKDFHLKQKLFTHILNVHAARKKYFCKICKRRYMNCCNVI